MTELNGSDQAKSYMDLFEQDEDPVSDIQIGDKIKLTKYAQSLYPLPLSTNSCEVCEVVGIPSRFPNGMAAEVSFDFSNPMKLDMLNNKTHCYRRSLVTLCKETFKDHLKKEQEIAAKQRQDDELRRNHEEALKKIENDFNRPFARRYALMTCDLVGNPWNR
jgi:hypothetical protein